MDKRGQVTIFIIIAIFLIALIAVIFVFRGSLFFKPIPAEIEPVYTSFLSCLEDKTLVGINILGSQAGYINLPDFEPGSVYMPFSSQLDFLGNPIPYWYYVSGNNIEKEQVPSRSNMERELENFLESKIKNCVYDNYYQQGFEIIQGEPVSKILIRDEEVEVNLNMKLNINKNEESVSINNHKIIVKTKFGKLYNSARKIYEYEQNNLFLEHYALDTLRLYAPVDGVELTCSPITWNAEEIFDELQEAIEANTQALKLRDGDFSLRKKENEYFIVDLSVEGDVRFLNSRGWANSFEVFPSEGNLLITKPVGNQPGLGILGFCYVPYHFVYNVRYPVLVQIFSGRELFQFPVAVVIQGNRPRKPLNASMVGLTSPELCENKNTFVQVDIYDNKFNLIDSEISYECFGERCTIGKTIEGTLKKEFPQCVNGYIMIRAEGFEDSKILYTVMNEDHVEIILDRLHELNVELKLDGKSSNENAMISFISEKSSKTIVYPETKKISLSEGQYEIQVYIYKNSSLKLNEVDSEQCMDVPASGVGGFFGFTQKKCFDIKIPSQIISNVLIGGGKENYYILESELENSGVIEINSEILKTPKSIEELQNNYLLFEERGLNIFFK